MSKSVIEHGADWYNNDEQVECPECRNDDYDKLQVELVHGSKQITPNTVLEGPGALVKCLSCLCTFFLERDD